MSPSTWTGRSTFTQPRTDGPSTMPATISRMTEGNRSARRKSKCEGRGSRDQADDEQVHEGHVRHHDGTPHNP